MTEPRMYVQLQIDKTVLCNDNDRQFDTIATYAFLGAIKFNHPDCWITYWRL